MSSPLPATGAADAKKRSAKKTSATTTTTKKKTAAVSASAKAARDTSRWNVKCSAMSARIANPIRAISDKLGNIAAGQNGETCNKPLIKLSVGDPTLDKNFFCAPQAHIDAVKATLDSHDYNGYVPAVGTTEGRQAVSEFWRRNFITVPSDDHSNNNNKKHNKREKTEAAVAEEKAAYERKVASIPWQHVVLTSGGSHAIQIAITSLCGAGDSILLPTPCFPHYVTICDTFKIKKKFYKLDPKKHWEANLEHIAQLCDASTKMLVMTNPSNPCGSNYSRKHVKDILKLAEKLKLPVFSDEIYAGMVFQNEKKHPNAVGNKQRQVFTSVVDFNTSVPRVVLGGTAKQFAVPGWRLGWLLYAGNSSKTNNNNINNNTLPTEAAVEAGQKYSSSSGDNLLHGIEQQALLIVGPTSLAQGALPAFLSSYSTSMSPQPVKSAEALAEESQAEKDAAFFYRYVTQIEKCARTFVTALNARCRVPGEEAAAVGEGESESSPEESSEEASDKRRKVHRHMVYAQMPQGSMYVMMKVNFHYFTDAAAKDTYTFFEALLKEQHVQLIPGSAFRRPGYLRVVITRPESILLEAVDRIAEFCHAHFDAEKAAKHALEKAEKLKAKKKKQQQQSKKTSADTVNEKSDEGEELAAVGKAFDGETAAEEEEVKSHTESETAGQSDDSGAAVAAVEAVSEHHEDPEKEVV